MQKENARAAGELLGDSEPCGLFGGTSRNRPAVSTLFPSVFLPHEDCP